MCASVQIKPEALISVLWIGFAAAGTLAVFGPLYRFYFPDPPDARAHFVEPRIEGAIGFLRDFDDGEGG